MAAQHRQIQHLFGKPSQIAPPSDGTVRLLNETDAAPPTSGSTLQLAKVRLKEADGGPKAGTYAEMETNGVSASLLATWRSRVHPDDAEKLESAIRLNLQLQAPPEHHAELMRRHAELPTTPRHDDAEEAEDPSTWDLEAALDLKHRAEVGVAYGVMPSWEEVAPLLPPSRELRKHQTGAIKRGAGVSAASTALNAATHGGVGEGLSALHTLNQGRELYGASSSAAAAESQKSIETLASGRLKEATSSGLAASVSVPTGIAVGGAVGTAIPVPVLGTLTGMAVGALVAFIASKLTKKGAEMALVDKRQLHHACLDVHMYARAGDPQAIAVFESFAIDRAVIGADDGWKALAEKVGAEAPGRSDDGL